MACEEKMHIIKKNGEIKLKQKLPTPASQDNGIKTNAVFVVTYMS